MKINGMSAPKVDDMWDMVCFTGAGGETFQPRDVINGLVKHHGWNRKTAELCWNKFVHYALANPDIFCGPRSRLEKTGAGYRLGDNPER